MKSTKKLSEAHSKLNSDCLEKIKSFFKGKPYVRIIIEPKQHLTINTGTGLGQVTEVTVDGDILFTQSGRNCIYKPAFCDPLPTDALLCILDELERMKKANLLKKP